MEAAVRFLREGVVRGETAPMMVVCDTLETPGAQDILQQILTGFHAALQQGRSQAKHMVIAAVDKPPAHYVSSLAEPQQPAPAAHVVDLYSDPYGWLASEASGSSSSSSSEPLPLDQLQRMLLQERDGQAGDAPAAAPSTPAASVASGSGGSSSSSAGPELCIVLDSLSTLLLRYHHLQVLLLLRALASSPRVSCVLALLHQDLHQARELAALQHAACCLARLTPVGELEAQMAARQGGRHPIGAVEFRYQRRTGRVRVERQLYSRDAASQQLQLFTPPEQAANITAQALVASTLKDEAAKAASSAAEPSEEELARALGSTMRLSLTEQERQAREAVRLPYEHRGEGRLYQTQDFKDYLPVAAGGSVAGVPHQVGSSRLGHILYVRDSEEEHDSDEDPDDDLDI